jgi:predicted membrane channel-forming protein YqfA (hemolysin III family)
MQKHPPVNTENAKSSHTVTYCNIKLLLSGPYTPCVHVLVASSKSPFCVFVHIRNTTYPRVALAGWQYRAVRVKMQK